MSDNKKNTTPKEEWYNVVKARLLNDFFTDLESKKGFVKTEENTYQNGHTIVFYNGSNVITIENTIKEKSTAGFSLSKSDGAYLSLKLTDIMMHIDQFLSNPDYRIYNFQAKSDITQ